MTFREHWIRHPQSLLVRKAIFQAHLWTGIGIGLYVLVISISGSMLVYRPELLRAFTRQPPVVAGTGERMTLDELKNAARRSFPEYKVTDIWKQKNPDQAVEIWLERGGERKQRLFDPYSGADLGDTLRSGYRVMTWLLDLHDNLLSGHTGRLINSIGGILIAFLCLTGAFIWWPGVATWRRSLTIDWKAGFMRFNWDLHSAIGFWSLAFTFLWGISGIYLSAPGPFNAAVEFLEPLERSGRTPRVSETILFWLSRLHFGRFAGWPGKVLWVVIGLAPAVLFVTGAILWWHRVIRNGSWAIGRKENADSPALPT